MATRMQQRRATAAQWTSADPTLAPGEIGFETDTSKFKIGNGVNAWGSLEYFSTVSGFATESYVDTAVANVLDSAPETLDTLNELAAALNDDPAFFTNINTTITDGDSATLTSAQNYADGLASNYDAAGSASTAETNANNYTDGEISSLDSSLKSYADQAEADAISTASSDATTKANTAESNANSYTDTLIGDGTVDGTSGNTVTDRISSAISGLVDSAPATLDTLNELSAALNDDADFATTVTNSIATKAPLAQPLNAQTTSYTLQSSDNGGVVKASGTITITVPDAIFNAGERVDIVNTGTGVITISAGTGVTLLSKESAATIDTQYGAATLLFDSASQAFLIGDIA